MHQEVKLYRDWLFSCTLGAGNHRVTFFFMRRALVIFAKNPQKGKVKTRLANDIGKTEALNWYVRLLKRTEGTVQGLTAEKTVFWSNAIPMHPPAFYRDEFDSAVQTGEGLGERMSNALKGHFRKGYNSMLIIGTDCWDLRPKHIEAAYNALKTNDVVIGPAKDGGYYLLGINSFNESLFEDIAWSTGEVTKQTIEKCEKQGLSYQLLEALSDVDKVFDLPMV